MEEHDEECEAGQVNENLIQHTMEMSQRLSNEAICKYMEVMSRYFHCMIVKLLLIFFLSVVFFTTVLVCHVLLVVNDNGH
jgi:hypothetical protein